MLKKSLCRISYLVYRGFYSFTAIVLLLTSFVLIGPDTAHAYIDPGAGSALVALIAAGFTGLIVSFRLWRAKLRAYLTKNSSDEQEESDPTKSSSPSDNDS